MALRNVAAWALAATALAVLVPSAAAVDRTYYIAAEEVRIVAAVVYCSAYLLHMRFSLSIGVRVGC